MKQALQITDDQVYLPLIPDVRNKQFFLLMNLRKGSENSKAVKTFKQLLGILQNKNKILMAQSSLPYPDADLHIETPSVFGIMSFLSHAVHPSQDDV